MLPGYTPLASRNIGPVEIKGPIYTEESSRMFRFLHTVRMPAGLWYLREMNPANQGIFTIL
jgi:hypothetical protein